MLQNLKVDLAHFHFGGFTPGEVAGQRLPGLPLWPAGDSVFDHYPQRSFRLLILIGRRAEECTVAEIGAAIERHRIKDRVVMPGELESENVFRLIKQSSIFALPSYSEGLGLVVQEALHYGCPVIGYTTGGIPELIEHEENGLLVPCGNVRALQDGLERLINDTRSWQKFGRNARDSIERKGMNAKTMKALYRTLYGDILSESSTKQRIYKKS